MPPGPYLCSQSPSHCAAYQASIAASGSSGLSVTAASHTARQPGALALVLIFGGDLNSRTLTSAAKLIGADGIVYAVYILVVPRQLSLDSGLSAEESHGRSILERARIQARRLEINIRTSLLGTRSAGSTLAEEAAGWTPTSSTSRPATRRRVSSGSARLRATSSTSGRAAS
jgi:hypothetical protein